MYHRTQSFSNDIYPSKVSKQFHFETQCGSDLPAVICMIKFGPVAAIEETCIFGLTGAYLRTEPADTHKSPIKGLESPPAWLQADWKAD